MGGNGEWKKGNFNDEVMRHPAEHGEPSVLQPSLTTSFSHAFRIDLVRIINYAFRIYVGLIVNILNGTITEGKVKFAVGAQNSPIIQQLDMQSIFLAKWQTIM